jgi:hypothetical protein
LVAEIAKTFEAQFRSPKVLAISATCTKKGHHAERDGLFVLATFEATKVVDLVKDPFGRGIFNKIH